jgi:hypothetical protein
MMLPISIIMGKADMATALTRASSQTVGNPLGTLMRYPDADKSVPHDASYQSKETAMRISTWCLAITLLFSLPVSSLAWETVFDADGVSVWQRPYADSPLLEVRGEIEVRASLNALMALLRDADYNRHWVYRSGGATILDMSDYEQAYVYGVVDAPFPMRDRDTVVRFDYHQEPVTREITINITNAPDRVPPADGLVRVPDFGGFWKLQPAENATVKVIYQVHGDPGGWVPVWIANLAAARSVIRTLQNLPAALERYRDARSEFVQELSVR